MSNPDFKAELAGIEARLLQAYERGRDAGRTEERQRIGRMLQIDTTSVATLPQPPKSGAGRVASGTIRPIVHEILGAEPGLTKAELTRRVKARNPEIAGPSISNELSRNEKGLKKGHKLYRRARGGRWHLHTPEDELPETEGPAVNVVDRPAGVTRARMNGGDHDETTTALNSPGSA